MTDGSVVREPRGETPSPTISVVIPTWNRPKLLERAVESVMDQTRQPLELIVVNNGDEPVSSRTVRSNAKVLDIEPNAGASRARNHGARQAKGEFVAFLDDDDVWDENYLDHMFRAIRERSGEVDCLIGSKQQWIDGVRVPYKCVRTVEGLLQELYVRNPGVGGQNTVVRRTSFLEVGGYNPRLIGGNDKALVIEYLRRPHMAVVPVPEAVAIKGGEAEQRLTDASVRVQAKKAFYREYGDEMSFRQKAVILVQIVLLRCSYTPVLRHGETLARRAMEVLGRSRKSVSVSPPPPPGNGAA